MESEPGATFNIAGHALASYAYALAERPLVVGVDGPAGLGKSGLVKEIQRHLIFMFKSDAAIVQTDSYFLHERASRRAAGLNGNDPAAMRLDDLRRDVECLCAGATIRVRGYDHATGLFGPEAEVASAPIVLVDGIHSLHPTVMDGLPMPIRIFLRASEAENRRLRWERDVATRGYTVAEWERLWADEWAAQEAFLMPELAGATMIFERIGERLVRLNPPSWWRP